MKHLWRVLGLVAIACVILTGVFAIGSIGAGNSQTDNGGGLMLVKPALAQTSAGSFLQTEAGISAYVNTGSTLDPARAKSAFKIVETETSEYIIGTVAVNPDEQDTGTSWTHDVHAFVHRDGWVVAYYLSGEPVGKMIGKKYCSTSTLSTNYLAEGLTKVGGALGIATNSLSYYHFQYPGANRITKIVGSNFSIKIPTEFQVHEISGGGRNRAYIKPGPGNIYYTISSDSPRYDHISLSDLSTGILHTIGTDTSGGSSTVPGNVALLFLYYEP